MICIQKMLNLALETLKIFYTQSLELGKWQFLGILLESSLHIHLSVVWTNIFGTGLNVCIDFYSSSLEIFSLVGDNETLTFNVY